MRWGGSLVSLLMVQHNDAALSEQDVSDARRNGFLTKHKIWKEVMKMGKKGLLVRAGICFMVAAFVLSFGSISQAEPKSIKVSAVISMTGFMAGNGIQLHEAYEIITKKVNAND